jgi:hypothetical protein
MKKYTEAELDFITPASPVNDAAFERMCQVLELSEDERILTRMAISNYETQKQRGDGKQ